ncbi:MAG: 4-(cytidine 5'-diphospho)-2-C-methyl-D-erythritol kinase [Burkholderiaceae bacterium]
MLTPAERSGGEVRDVPAPAKINRFLHVTGRRDDGYHLLESVFQLIDWADRIDVRVRSDGQIVRIGEVDGVAPDQDLTVRAARLLQQASGCRLGAEIALTKVIPMGGGLGGGSSDAATVMMLLDALWDLRLPPPELARLGLQLGADLPFFLFGGSALARGVGEQLQAIAIPESWFVLIAPPVAVPTARVFGDAELTRNTPPLTISGFQDERPGSFDAWQRLQQQALHNDLQPVVQRHYPQVALAIGQLEMAARNAGLAPEQVRMSGSGACIFLPVSDPDLAQRIASDAVLRDVGRVRVCRSLSRHPLGSRQVG